jgi:hypothetical protein
MNLIQYLFEVADLQIHISPGVLPIEELIKCIHVNTQARILRMLVAPAASFFPHIDTIFLAKGMQMNAT